jgi:hypothetical protein
MAAQGYAWIGVVLLVATLGFCALLWTGLLGSPPADYDWAPLVTPNP